MASEKSLRRRSTTEELERQIARAAKALRGSTDVTISSVAKRVAQIVPESMEHIVQLLNAMGDAERQKLLGTTPTRATALPPLRPARTGDWNLGRPPLLGSGRRGRRSQSREAER